MYRLDFGTKLFAADWGGEGGEIGGRRGWNVKGAVIQRSKLKEGSRIQAPVFSVDLFSIHLFASYIPCITLAYGFHEGGEKKQHLTLAPPQQAKYYRRVLPVVLQWTSCHQCIARLYAQLTLLRMWDDCKQHDLLEEFGYIDGLASFMRSMG